RSISEDHRLRSLKLRCTIVFHDAVTSNEPALLQGNGSAEPFPEPAPVLRRTHARGNLFEVRSLGVAQRLQRQSRRTLAPPPLPPLGLRAPPEAIPLQVHEGHTADLHPALHLAEVPHAVAAQA